MDGGRDGWVDRTDVVVLLFCLCVRSSMPGPPTGTFIMVVCILVPTKYHIPCIAV